MKHGSVQLLGIQIVPRRGVMCVNLLFRDTSRREHVATYSIPDFLRALGLISTRSQEQHIRGLRSLGIKPGLAPRDRVYLLDFKDGFIGELGSLYDSACNQLMLLLHENGVDVVPLRNALVQGRAHKVDNHFLH